MGGVQVILKAVKIFYNVREDTHIQTFVKTHKTMKHKELILV